MKINYLITSSVLGLLFFSCNPNAGKEPVIDVVKLNATINNTNQSIPLGDTLKVILKLPDTLTGTLRTQTVQSLERAFFAMRTFKVDTINRKGVNILFPVIWASVGNIEGNFSYVLKNTNKPYEVVINFKPTEKGLYYFEVIAQPGVLKVNGNLESNLLVNFSALDKHLTLVSGYFGGQAWIDAANQQISEGFGVYAFRVN